MALKSTVVVLRQSHITVGTFHNMSASPAGYKPRVTATVQKKYTLLSLFQSVRQKLLKFPAENGTIPLLQLLSQIRRIYRWQLPTGKSLPEIKQLILPGVSPFVCLQGRRGRAKYQTGAMKQCHLFRYLSGMILGRGFALIATLVLLVHNDDADVGKGSEQC